MTSTPSFALTLKRNSLPFTSVHSTSTVTVRPDRVAAVIDVNQGAERPLAFFKMRTDHVDARPLHQADHVAGGEHMRHGLKVTRLRKQMRHGLVLRHAVGEAMGRSGGERR